mmetsp:Transcript_49461/g.143444  ORF Transcript_49461/g.143444 Transcript_49461/m.143444 type:complete len:266 (-) Transcript_49461:413-1210(-)
MTKVWGSTSTSVMQWAISSTCVSESCRRSVRYWFLRTDILISSKSSSDFSAWAISEYSGTSDATRPRLPPSLAIEEAPSDCVCSTTGPSSGWAMNREAFFLRFFISFLCNPRACISLTCSERTVSSLSGGAVRLASAEAVPWSSAPSPKYSPGFIVRTNCGTETLQPPSSTSSTSPVLSPYLTTSACGSNCFTVTRSARARRSSSDRSRTCGMTEMRCMISSTPILEVGMLLKVDRLLPIIDTEGRRSATGGGPEDAAASPPPGI